MNTKPLIDRLVPWCPGWNRSSGAKNLLSVVQVAIDKLYSDNGDRFIYRGTDNKGFPPYLITQAGTYRYNIIAANLSCGNITRTINGQSYTFIAKNIRRVFIDVTNTRADYFRSYIGQPYYYSYNSFNARDNRIYVADIAVTSMPAFENANTPPYVEFQEDPGAETEKYFVEFTYAPPRLLSESIPLPVPAEYESEIEFFAQGYCQHKENGRMSEAEMYFENVVIPRFHDYMDQGATMNVAETQPRTC